MENIHRGSKVPKKKRTRDGDEGDSRRSLPCQWNKLKIVKTSGSASMTLTRFGLRHPNDCTDEEYKAFYRKVFSGLQGAVILDSPEYGLSVQLKGYPLLPEDQYRVRIH